jgi:hypothetical protein
MQELMPYEDFKETETIQYGTAATSASANHAPLFIKEELNRLYNYTRMKFSEQPLEWDARKSYKIDDVVSHNGVVYQATADNGNQEPPSAAWKTFDVASLDLELKYVQIHTDKYINLITRNNHKMMRANTNSTTAIMTPKNGLVPWDNGANSSLGTGSLRFKNVYSINGNFSTVNTGNIISTTGTIGNLHSTTVTADNFIGVASSAKYADIAEKYTTDVTYEPGTVLGFGGEAELTLYNENMKVAGVVSTEPGYMLNSEIDGLYVALKGRVPCKIIGSAQKGQYIIATNDGFGKAIDDYTFEESKILLGIAISDSEDGIVEIKV